MGQGLLFSDWREAGRIDSIELLCGLKDIILQTSSGRFDLTNIIAALVRLSTQAKARQSLSTKPSKPPNVIRLPVILEFRNTHASNGQV
jgi:hypothetical protein